MTTVIPSSDVGIAAFEQSDIFTQVELFNHNIPVPVTESFPVAESMNLAKRSVVGLDASGNLVLAKTSATAVKPIGVLVASVVTQAGETKKGTVYRAGNFNRDALVWHADYDTNAKKEAAFRGADAPTNIIVRGRL